MFAGRVSKLDLCCRSGHFSPGFSPPCGGFSFDLIDGDHGACFSRVDTDLNLTAEPYIMFGCLLLPA
jgi:hypothetical protein